MAWMINKRVVLSRDPPLFTSSFLLENMVRSWFDCLKMGAWKRFLSQSVRFSFNE